MVPPGRQTRPTSDRVREAIFNALVSLGAVADAAVIDLFAGSGALGIEALSRGAASCVFVDHDRAAVATIRENLATARVPGDPTVRVVQAEVERWLSAQPAPGPFDLAFADPPYAYDGWPALLAAVPAEVIVVESDRPIAPVSGFVVVREKRYGGTVVGFHARADQLPGA